MCCVLKIKCCTGKKGVFVMIDDIKVELPLKRIWSVALTDEWKNKHP